LQTGIRERRFKTGTWIPSVASDPATIESQPCRGTADDQAAAPLLSVRSIGVQFGGVTALHDLSFDMPNGIILGVIGPNGAGKTTLLNCLSRLQRPDSGDILFEGRSILALPAHRMANAGIARTFQNLALFERMSVLENVLVGAHSRSSSTVLSDTLGLQSARRRDAVLKQQARALVVEFDLEAQSDSLIAGLPFALRKQVELARAIASEPKLLLLDEPAGGLSPEGVAQLGDAIRKLRDWRGISVLIIEHNMALIMSTSDRILVLDAGARIAEGTPDTIRTDPRVIAAYLGNPVP
jgi:branched-chain amino acid transport system ATP-binding protein